MSKEVAISSKDAKKMLDEARVCFRRMQESWFYFGKSIHAIYNGKVYSAVEDGISFKDYCEREFTNINYQNIMKMISVIENYGDAIENRIKKDTQYKVPTYEDCYHVVTVIGRDEVPKEEVSKLKKEVLDGKITFKQVREKVRALISAHVKKTKEEVEESARDIEKRLTKQLVEEGIDELDEEDFVESDDEDEIETEELEDVEEDDGGTTTSAIAAAQVRVDYLNDNFRDLLKSIEAEGPSDEATELCERLEELYENVDKFLNGYEQLNTKKEKKHGK